ncbi:MAG TPA: nucleotide exchange factor GrpE, partial [Burkholderiaceae bacterium]|nr:nucleotide exchange factor GrpE [Burkholderiaceae bacterium]
MSQKKPHRDDYDESRPENGIHDEPSEVANTADAANTNDSVDDAEFTEDLGSLLAEAEEKIAQYHDELLRARAEVENMRRRNQEETAKVRKFAIEGFAESLVPVKDSLEAALAASDQSPESWREGVET